MIHRFDILTLNEKNALAAWLETKAMTNYPQFALVFSSESGIGVSVTAKLRDKDGHELQQDITDYEAW
jgi:hypothetical protein